MSALYCLSLKLSTSRNKDCVNQALTQNLT